MIKQAPFLLFFYKNPARSIAKKQFFCIIDNITFFWPRWWVVYPLTLVQIEKQIFKLGSEYT